MKTDEHYSRLVQEHQKYECQLESLLDKPFLNSDEQLEKTVIKKKLTLKDQMQVIIYRHQLESSTG